jgi:putative colanic acid biosynthesis UDP-glucose lipid carrier transferase
MYDVARTISDEPAVETWVGAPASPDNVREFAPLAAVASSRAKRLLDILIALTALTILAPFLICVAIALVIESPGPALFRQRRTGLGGKIFTIYKFRTMTVSEDHEDLRQARRTDERITVVGGILRKLSIDELPQLLNVLKGEMSIVGPRPHALGHDQRWGHQVPDYRARFRARPGLTGLAQVNGLRGEILSPQCLTRRIAADNAYIESWSFWLDLKIILQTIPGLFNDPKAY